MYVLLDNISHNLYNITKNQTVFSISVQLGSVLPDWNIPNVQQIKRETFFFLESKSEKTKNEVTKHLSILSMNNLQSKSRR